MSSIAANFYAAAETEAHRHLLRCRSDETYRWVCPAMKKRPPQIAMMMRTNDLPKPLDFGVFPDFLNKPRYHIVYLLVFVAYRVHNVCSAL